jgi:ribonuclease HI
MYYTDGSTYKNGREGQDSSMIVLCPGGFEIREHLGDYSINYAELMAIIRAFEVCDLGSEIRSDSKICVGWVHKYKRTKSNAYLEDDIRYAQKLYHEKGLSLKHVPREDNLAGIRLDQKPFYG